MDGLLHGKITGPVMTSFAMFSLSLALYVAAFALSIASFATRSAALRKVATSVVGSSMLVHLISLTLLHSETSTLPIVHPSGFFGCYALATFIYALLAARRYDVENMFFVFMAIPLGVLVGAYFLQAPTGAPTRMPTSWLLIHLAAIVLSLAAFTIAFSAGVMLFVQDRLMKAKSFGFWMENLPPLDVLDNLTYRNVSLGFVSLSLGALLGFSGAPRAWGSVFQLDVRVAVSLAAWAMYGVYLHTRSRRGWRGRKLALFSLGGFLVILVASLVASKQGGFHG